MSYTLKPTPEFLRDVKKHRKSGNKKLLTKIEHLLLEIEQHPREGTGKVEQLKYYDDSEVYSRRIDQEHRLVYEILEDKTIVILMTAFGHYR